MDMRNVSQMSVGILMVLGMTFGCLRSGTANASVISGVQKPSRVEVVGKPGSYQLLRDGKPYFIKGVGGNASRKLLLEIGGNSFRTWGADNIGKVLDDAHKDGLTVTVGIWLQHASEFDYNNKVEVKKQFEMCKKIVEENKDHPALLMWAFGNEMEANPDNIAVWHAVEEIAAMSKKIDPNHPMVALGRQVAHALKLDQPAFETLVAMHTQHELAQQQAIAGLVEKQMEALGPKAADRTAAVKNFLTAKYGERATALLGTQLQLKEGVELLERMMRDASSGGMPSFSQRGRDGAPEQTVENRWFPSMARS
jgi:hypothetical protein